MAYWTPVSKSPGCIDSQVVAPVIYTGGAPDYDGHCLGDTCSYANRFRIHSDTAMVVL